MLELIDHILPHYRSQQAYNFQNILIYINLKNDITICVSKADILFFILNMHFLSVAKNSRCIFVKIVVSFVTLRRLR